MTKKQRIKHLQRMVDELRRQNQCLRYAVIGVMSATPTERGASIAAKHIWREVNNIPDHYLHGDSDRQAARGTEAGSDE